MALTRLEILLDRPIAESRDMTLDERLLAYVDGELAGEELTKFEAEMAVDPRLAAEVDKHRGLATRMAAARAERAEAAGQGKSKPGRAPPRARLGGLHWLAIVVGLAVGVAAGLAGGRYLWPQEGSVVATDGVLTAAGPLETALDSQMSDQKGPVTVGASFRTARGRYCRTFRSRPDSLAGLACRQGDGGWALQTVTVLGASDAMPRAVLTAMDGLISGVPLDEAAERAARDKGWK
jgi:hypothetical protein